jgi:chromosome segregation ATPase
LLLFTVTSALGALVFLQSRYDEVALMQFRWLLLNHPMRNLADAVASNPTHIWYGALSLFAMMTIAIVFKSVSNAELRAFKDRLVEAEVAKAELETLLQDALWKEKHAGTVKEAAVKDLEASSGKIIALEDRLSDAERMLRHRDGELETLRAKVHMLTERPAARPSDGTPEQADIREELRKQMDLSHAKDLALQELDKDSTAKITALQAQLAVKEKLAQQREKELAALKAQLAETGVARSQVESFLAEELQKVKQAVKARDAALKEVESNLTLKVRALESQLSEKQERLDSGSAKLEAVESEGNTLTRQLAEAIAARERAETILQQELKKKMELLQSKDLAFTELQENSRAKLDFLGRQLAEKEKLQRGRDKEFDALRAQLTETGAAKSDAERFLLADLQKEKQAVKLKETALRELESRLTADVRALETQIGEKLELLQSRNTELETLKSEGNVLKGQLADVIATQERTETSLQQALKNKAELLQSKETALRALESQMMSKVGELENQLREKDTLLKDRDSELGSFRIQLTKLGSAKEEIEGLLREELSKAMEALQAKDSTIQGLEATFNKTVEPLKIRVTEQQKLLKSRAGEVETLRSEVSKLNAQLVKTEPGTDWTMRLLDEPPRSSETKRLEENFKRIQELESVLREKEDLLKSHDEKTERLEVELKEKRTELAKHEIAVWQAYEKRTLWRQRLAKFGISIKDRGADL